MAVEKSVVKSVGKSVGKILNPVGPVPRGIMTPGIMPLWMRLV